MFITSDMSGEYDADAEYSRGQRDRASGNYDPPSRLPTNALAEGLFGDNDSFEAAEAAYKAGYNSDDD
jgi:hypothetical protein